METPVLILTARDDKESVVTLLNAGADDYVAKPFDLGELLARAKALIRRGKGQSAAVLKVGDIEINTSNLSVRRNGELVTLPSLPDGDEWTRFEAARRAMSEHFFHSTPAPRYRAG